MVLNTVMIPNHIPRQNNMKAEKPSKVQEISQRYGHSSVPVGHYSEIQILHEITACQL